MKGRTLLLAFVLVGIIGVGIILTPIFLVGLMDDEQSAEPDFFVGVEYAVYNYSVAECKALVDRTKNFTNLFVIDSFNITSDIIKLNDVCDYVYDAGLYFAVFFLAPIGGEEMTLRYNFWPHLWVTDAKEQYGDKFLGVYAMDEPGGSQLDQANFAMIDAADIENAAQAHSLYLDYLWQHVNYYSYIRRYEDITVLTADYGLYWFDYEAGYDTVLAEFGWNHSRQLHVALCRGAANVQNRDWGVIETWTYNREPYLTSAEELYDDLVLAYHNGAKYAVIFNHPNTTFSDYGILTEEHFDAMEAFWSYVKDNPGKHGVEKATVAYVLPETFGYGFRNGNDKIWGKDPDELVDDVWGNWTSVEFAEKVWGEVNSLLGEYGSRLDIVYSDPEFDDVMLQKYEQLFFWNQTVE